MALNFCPHCGLKLDPSFRFCPSCGCDLEHSVSLVRGEAAGKGGSLDERLPELAPAGTGAPATDQAGEEAEGEQAQAEAGASTVPAPASLAAAAATAPTAPGATTVPAPATGAAAEGESEPGVEPAPADEPAPESPSEPAPAPEPTAGPASEPALASGPDPLPMPNPDPSRTEAIALPAEKSATSSVPHEGSRSDASPDAGAPGETSPLDLSGLDIFAESAPYAPELSDSWNRPYSPDITAVMRPISADEVERGYAATGASATPTTFEAPVPRSATRCRLIIVLVAVALLIAAGAYIATQNPWQQIHSLVSSEATQAEQAAEPEKAEAEEPPAEEASAEEGSDAPTEDEVRTAIREAYEELPSFHARIDEAVTTYNGTFLDPDRDKRQEAANQAFALRDRIQKAVDDLAALDRANASALEPDFANVTRLQNDQLQRIAVIAKSWEISLSYERPSQHQEEILEPLTHDLVDGVSSYLLDYNRTYSASKPTL